MSWHYTVDDHAIVQHLPRLRDGLPPCRGRQGTGRATPPASASGSASTPGQFAQAQANAASLVRQLMEGVHGIPIDRVVQHAPLERQDCPKTIGPPPGALGELLALCWGKT